MAGILIILMEKKHIIVFLNNVFLPMKKLSRQWTTQMFFLNVDEYECDCFKKNIKMPNIYPELSQDEKNKKYRSIIYDAWNQEKNSYSSNSLE